MKGRINFIREINQKLCSGEIIHENDWRQKSVLKKNLTKHKQKLYTP